MSVRELPLRIMLEAEQPCSATNCGGRGFQTITVGRVDQPDPHLRQYSFTGFCPVCRGPRAGSFFLRGDDLSVEVALLDAEAAQDRTNGSVFAVTADLAGSLRGGRRPAANWRRKF